VGSVLFLADSVGTVPEWEDGKDCWTKVEQRARSGQRIEPATSANGQGKPQPDVRFVSPTAVNTLVSNQL
jgi:hypothetical protein